jgi:MFS family permease
MPRVRQRPAGTPRNARAPASPRGVYYGWVIVAALAVTETTSWGVLYYAFTAFLEPMRASLGWSRASVAGAFSLALLLSGVVGLPVGRWLDRHGPRLIMTAGSCAAVPLVLAWSQVTSLAAFYLIWAGLGIVMAAVLYEPAFWVVSAWFTRRRGQALTLLTLIAGLASVIYVPLAGWLVAVRGWRQALVVLAVLLAAGTIPLHAFALRRRPADLGLAPDGVLAPVPGDPADQVPRNDPPASTPSSPHPSPPPGATARAALRGATFWLVTTAFVFSAFCSGVVFVYLVSYLIARGLAPTAAAGVVGLIGLAALPGRLVLTPLGDRLPRGRLTAGLFLAQAIALAVLLVEPGLAGVAGFVILFGAGYGAITPARAALLADYYGPRHYGRINGMVALALNLARALAPVTGGLAYALTGGYQAILWGLALLSVLAALAIMLAERRARQTGLVADASPSPALPVSS